MEPRRRSEEEPPLAFTLTPGVAGLLSAGIFSVRPLPVALLASVPLLLVFTTMGVRRGLRASVVGGAAALAIGLLVAADGQGSLAEVTLSYGMIAWAPAGLLTLGLARTRRAASALVLASGVGSLGLWALLVFMLAASGDVSIEVLQGQLGASVDAWIQLRAPEAMSDADLASGLAGLELNRDRYALWGAWLAPALSFGSVVVVLWMNLLYARWFTGRMEPDDDLTRWRLPVGVIHVFTAALAVIVLQVGPVGERIPRIDVLFWAGTNGAVALAILYWLQGVAVINHRFLRMRLSPLARMGGVAAQVALLVLPTTVLFLLVGLADAWFDVRKLDQ